MGFCRKCGHEMKEGELFCTRCGTKMKNMGNGEIVRPESKPMNNLCGSSYKIKKYIPIAIALLAILAVIGIGKTIITSHSPERQIIGTWYYEDNGASDASVAFYKDGTFYMSMGMDDTMDDIKGTYMLSGDKMIWRFSAGGEDAELAYTYKLKGNTLNLIHGEKNMTLKKD